MDFRLRRHTIRTQTRSKRELYVRETVICIKFVRFFSLLIDDAASAADGDGDCVIVVVVPLAAIPFYPYAVQYELYGNDGDFLYIRIASVEHIKESN